MLTIVALAELILCWVAWSLAFVKPRQQASAQTKVIKAPASKWGILLVMVSFALVWSYIRPVGFEKSRLSLIAAPIAAWQFYGPGRVAEIKLANGLSCTYLNNARTNSMVQDPSPTNPSWGDQSSDRLGYDGAMRGIAKRYLSSELDEDNGYSDTTAVVGFTAAFDRASNKAYERELHAQSRSHLYLPIDEDGDVSLGYDSANRLRQYQRGTLASTGGIDGAGGGSVSTAITLPATEQSKTYVLDGLGNWKSTAYTQVNGGGSTTAYNQSRNHNYVNEITSTTTVNGGSATISFSYDHGNNTGGVKGNGNLANDGVRTYQYDAFNRLIVVGNASTSDTLATYTYDAMGRRIRKVIADLGSSMGGLTGDIPAGTTDYLYDGQQIIEDRNGSNAAVAQYIWGMYIDELIQIKNLTTDSDFYVYSDLLYRAAALTDDDGNIVEVYDTDAYGNTIVFDAAGTGSNWWADDASVTNNPVNPYIFTGRQYDPESQIYYYRARYYQPVLGRFISRDPTLSNELMNLYEYVASNPIIFNDPTGLIPPGSGNYPHRKVPPCSHSACVARADSDLTDCRGTCAAACQACKSYPVAVQLSCQLGCLSLCLIAYTGELEGCLLCVAP